MQGTHVTYDVQKCIVAGMPCRMLPTTVQKFIVVVSADTVVATSVQIFIVMMMMMKRIMRTRRRAQKVSLKSLKVKYVIAHV